MLANTADYRDIWGQSGTTLNLSFRRHPGEVIHIPLVPEFYEMKCLILGRANNTNCTMKRAFLTYEAMATCVSLL